MKFFKGKIGRKQYWVRTLCFFFAGTIVFALPIVYEAFTATVNGHENDQESNPISGLISAILYLIGVILVTLSLVIGAPPRLRDLGRSGWLALIVFIPFVGIIGALGLLIYCGFFPSKVAANGDILEEGQNNE